MGLRTETWDWPIGPLEATLRALQTYRGGEQSLLGKKYRSSLIFLKGQRIVGGGCAPTRPLFPPSLPATSQRGSARCHGLRKRSAR
jgi:hypothetical protein